MSKVYYIGFYGDASAYGENRYIHPAGVSKMGYIANAIGRAGIKVLIISPAWLKYEKKTGIRFVSQRRFSVNENVDCILAWSIAAPGRISKALAILISKIWLTTYLLFHLRNKDTVIAYSSPFYLNILHLLKKIIGFKLILEVEEMYSIVFSMGKRWYKREKRLIDCADSYIFPNDMMCDYLRIRDKQQIIVYGPYAILDEPTESVNFADGKIHLVYAGIIDKLKNGAFNAIHAAKYLSSDYVIHILGFGAQNDVEDLEREISESNLNSYCKVVYEGKKTGKDYMNFMTGCHIGLSTQNNEGEYLKITFPSKVLAYLSMGLNVVSGDIEAVRKSKVSDLITYYGENSADGIANAINSMRLIEPAEIKSRITKLDCELIRILKQKL